MPDEPQPPVSQTVNVSGGGIMDGITGQWRQVVAMGFAGVVAFSFLFLQWQMIVQARQDRLYDRDLFRDTVKQIRDEDNRRTGEIKGAMDANTLVMRQLIEEIRAARREGRMQSGPAPVEMKKPPE
jgi:hypothetical protein